ncbi:hypothetical protein [Hyalangium sp.]|uniref:hypothetical protein n=1 Tax=Hyalangium sp. TaxID=2028555 RepID=UPI002D530D69|nr:hypothetical protein [Hyalangium sp.]HYI00558.1 hypothetical protein [Hyalangium sp.]
MGEDALKAHLKAGDNFPEITAEDQVALKHARAVLSPVAQVLSVIATRVRLEVNHG